VAFGDVGGQILLTFGEMPSVISNFNYAVDVLNSDLNPYLQWV